MNIFCGCLADALIKIEKCRFGKLMAGKLEIRLGNEWMNVGQIATKDS